MKKLATFLLSLALLFLAAGCGQLESGSFSDIPAEAPYLEDVQLACQCGLMSVREKHAFAPDDTFTAGDTARLVVGLDSLLNRQAQSDDAQNSNAQQEANALSDADCLARAAELGLFRAADPEQPVTRAELADALLATLPEDALSPIGQVENGAITDVGMIEPRAAGIYTLVRAGILLADENGAVGPDNTLTRAEAAGIAARAADPERRQALTLEAPDTWPDLSEQPAADDAFFEDAAILGNSLVDGLKLFSDLKSINYYSGTGVSVISALNTHDVLLPSGQYITRLDSLLEESYSKIYIELGINEIGLDPDYFIDLYAELIDAIQLAEPEATIYIMALLPVTKAKSDQGTFTMERVNTYNQRLYELADEKNCYYLDCCSPLQGPDGYLPAELAADGVHLTPNGYKAWEACIRTHYAW